MRRLLLYIRLYSFHILPFTFSSDQSFRYSQLHFIFRDSCTISRSLHSQFRHFIFRYFFYNFYQQDMEYPSSPPTYIDSRYRQPHNRRTSTSPYYSGRMAHPEEQYDHSTGNSRSWPPQQASNNYPSNPTYPSPFTQGTGNNQYQPAPGYTSTFGQGMGNNEYQPLPAYHSSIRQGDGKGDYHQVPANPSQITESGSSSHDQPPAYISPARASDSSNNSQLLPAPAPITWNSGLQPCA